MGIGTIQIQPMWNLPSAVSVSRFDAYANITLSTSSNSSWAGGITVNAAIYTRNGSTLSLSTSGSQSYQFTNTSNNSTNQISGIKYLSLPMNFNVTQQGDYWIAFSSSTASTNANWFTASNIFITAQSQRLFGVVGNGNNNTGQLALGFGIWSTTSAAFPASIAFSQITGAGGYSTLAQLPLFFQAENFTA